MTTPATGRKPDTTSTEPRPCEVATPGRPRQRCGTPRPGHDPTASEDPPAAPASHDDEKQAYELSDEDREWARRTAASLPPLTSRQRDRLGMLLRKRR
jgi:hypothetical protein